jgi:hypothetical protein
MGIGAFIALSVLAAVVCGRAGSGGGVVLFVGLALVLFVSTPMGAGLPGAVLDFFAEFSDATEPTLQGAGGFSSAGGGA